MEYSFENINNYNIDELYANVSKARILKTESINNPVVKLRSLSVEYLLNTLIKKTHPDIQTPVELSYDGLGKPHLILPDNISKIHISLSHSGEYVACMVSDKPCGIDIEIHSGRKYGRVAKRVCTEKELSLIKNAADFYDIWTIKEAALKACGLGLKYDMQLIESDNIIINEKKYAGTKLSAPAGYSLSIVEEA